MSAANSIFSFASLHSLRVGIAFRASFVFPSVLLLPFIVPFPGHASETDIRVVRSDNRSLVFEYTPGHFEPEVIREEVQEYRLYDFDGSTVLPSTEFAGSPDVRVRRIAVGFPSESGHAVQVISADYEEIPNVVVAPVPVLADKDGVPGIGSYVKDPSAYSKSGYDDAAVLSKVSAVRSMLVGTVDVKPVLFDPARRTVRKYTRMVVEIVFGRAAGTPVQGDDGILIGPALLNGSVAKNWQFARKGPSLRKTGPSVLAAGFWYRIPVSSEGIYILDALYLQSVGLNPSQIDPRTIKIYGNGGEEVPELVTEPRPEDLVQNAIYVQGESDGSFDAEDFVIFYAQPARGWEYNASTGLFDHYRHHYSDQNYYWFTYGGANGKRMSQVPSLSDPPAATPSHFTGLMMVNEDTINILGSGKDWYGPVINANSSMIYTRPLPGIVQGLPRTYRFSMVARSVGTTAFLIVKETGATIWQGILPSISSTDIYTIARELTVSVESGAATSNSQSQVSFDFTTSYLGGTAWLNWLEIQYPRSFAATGNYLRFRGPDTTGVVEYSLSGFTAAPFILDVSVPEDAAIITGATGSYTFRASATGGEVREYCAVASGGYKVPDAMTFVTNQDLHGITEGYDFIIIAPKEYRAAADRLAAHRENPEHGNLRTLIVEPGQIYNEFSGGLPDVTGVRDFLKYAYDTWSRPPIFVLYLGQGSFDYKARLGYQSSLVPTWQSDQSRHELYSYASDDFFVRFSTANNAPFIVGGRLNARSVAEADFLVDKVIEYDNGSARDPWKLRVLIIGDDSWTPEREDGDIHSEQAESLAETRVPDEIEKRKIFIAEYPTVITGQGRRKPGAYQDIIDEINQGALIVNFTGHGNPTVWAHEAIFSVQTSIPQLVNAGKLSVFFLATCNFSDFDDPNRQTGGEVLMNRVGGGAIGVVSATRKVFAVENFNLNRDIYERMFLVDAFGRSIVERPATALYLAKVEATNSVNDQKFFFMGDPTMRLQYPRGFASIDTIAGEPVDSIDGVARGDDDPVQIRALQRVSLNGVGRTEANLIDPELNGTILVNVNDATAEVSIPGFPPGAITPFSYKATGATVYRGVNSLTDGEFRSTFIVPKDISYADSTTRGRVIGYYFNDETDGLAYTGKVYVGGTDTTAASDDLGPTIDLFLNSRSFRPGDLVSHDPLLIIDLVDSSGINTSTSGIGHRIEAWINGSNQGTDLTEFYASKLDDYQRGTVQYQMRELPFGRNTLTVRAWDAYNNASTSETHFDVTSGDKLTITEVMNYPNPFARETEFTFHQNQLVPLDISIKIYTVAGRLIQTIDASSPGSPFIRIPWNGRDRDGDALANGVYLYKIIVSTVDGSYSSEALGKLSVLK